jgi:TonB family protein
MRLWLVAALLSGCGHAPPRDHSLQAGIDAPEVGDSRAQFPDFHAKARQVLEAEFRGNEVAQRAQLSHGRWRTVLRISLDPLAQLHTVERVRSSGFNGLDEEALAACRRVKEWPFPPQEAIDTDNYAYLTLQLVVEVP